jgi:hypothetical protein
MGHIRPSAKMSFHSEHGSRRLAEILSPSQDFFGGGEYYSAGKLQHLACRIIQILSPNWCIPLRELNLACLRRCPMVAKVLLRRIAMVALPACSLMGCSPEHKDNGRPAIRVEKSVTHIVSPVDEEGYVDYLKAANLRHSEGITPTNNWEVALREVFGPLENLDEASEQEYYAKLGITKPMNPPKLGEYLQIPWEFGPNFTQSDACDIKGPWTPEDYPELAGWLDRQSRQLNELVAGAQFPKYYAPFVMSSETHAKGVRATREYLDDVGRSSDALQRLASRIASNLAGGLPERPAPLSRGHASETVGQCRQLCRVLSNRVQLRIGKKAHGRISWRCIASHDC